MIPLGFPPLHLLVDFLPISVRGFGITSLGWLLSIPVLIFRLGLVCPVRPSVPISF